MEGGYKTENQRSEQGSEQSEAEYSAVYVYLFDAGQVIGAESYDCIYSLAGKQNTSETAE